MKFTKGIDLSSNIKSLITKGELDAAIQLGLENNPNYVIILISSRQKKVEKFWQLGTISLEEYQNEMQGISEGLIKYADSIESNKLYKKKEEYRVPMKYLILLLMFLDYEKVKYLVGILFFIVLIFIGIKSIPQDKPESAIVQQEPVNTKQDENNGIQQEPFTDTLDETINNYPENKSAIILPPKRSNLDLIPISKPEKKSTIEPKSYGFNMDSVISEKCKKHIGFKNNTNFPLMLNPPIVFFRNQKRERLMIYIDESNFLDLSITINVLPKRKVDHLLKFNFLDPKKSFVFNLDYPKNSYRESWTFDLRLDNFEKLLSQNLRNISLEVANPDKHKEEEDNLFYWENLNSKEVKEKCSCLYQSIKNRNKVLGIK